MSYAVGSLVKARGREWVVLPESEKELLILRPLGGTEDETAGIYLPLEKVEPARFELPDPNQVGDYRSCRLLRDALRLGFRSSAGPFRSFAAIAVEPRPYQLVPILMALKLDPVRLLVADDVGIGKSIEAGLIARELIDRGEVQRMAVLCPPHLAEQWQSELRDKFHLEAELVLSSTATRLERPCRLGESLFEYYPYVVVSTDFIKSDRRREEFIRTCPELVIVDEAHTCAFGAEGRGGRHQRHQLVKGLSADKNRHLILVTATPHSGKEEEFRSLLTLLSPEFAGLPDDLTGPHNEPHRRRLAQLFVQRRRADIRNYLDSQTIFPEREEAEETYKLSPAYQAFLKKVLNYARETVADASGGHFRQRVRWWSALALLRSIASSPAAAAATLRSRAACAGADSLEEADEIGRRTVMDLTDEDASEPVDIAPGSDYEDEVDGQRKDRRRLLDLAREADSLTGKNDEKLLRAVKLVETLVNDGYQPIVFCRFIPTAEYVADALRGSLPKDVEVAAVTGMLPPSEREDRVSQLAEAPKHVLVCTDCLSEGVNLQEHFNAVLHFDLAWNPTRHEQREGRVDRYGQPRPKVRTITYYGIDNQIDGIVLNVLINKHKTIRNSLGISVPVPARAEQVLDAIFEGLLLREKWGYDAGRQLSMFEDFFKPQTDALHLEWESAGEREKRSRTMFAQETIKVDEVAGELKAVRSAIGSGVDVASFVRDAALSHRGTVAASNGSLTVDLAESPPALREAAGRSTRFKARFELPVSEGEVYLSRTHPIVEGLATYVMDSALDPLGEGGARRCGAIRTKAVDKRTTLLLVRFRYHIITQTENKETQLLAEDCQLVAFEGSPENAQWLDPNRAEAIFNADPETNIAPETARDFVRKVVEGFGHIRPHLEQVAVQRGEELLQSHLRVRAASRQTRVRYRVEPNLPPDVLGVYVYLPVA